MQRADQRKYHYIYKITRDDGRYYIGMHSTDDLEDGYFGSGKKITRSIKKHGKERHTKVIMEYLPTRKDLKAREEQIITEEMRADPLCMNLAPGGGGGFTDKEHQRKTASAGGKIGGATVGKIYAPTLAARCRDAGTLFTLGFAGKKHSEETKAKMRASAKAAAAKRAKK